MIRIIFLSLVTLTLACGNTRPKPADSTTPTAIAEPTPAPVATPVESPETASRTETAPNRSAKPEVKAEPSTRTKAATKAVISVSTSDANVQTLAQVADADTTAEASPEGELFVTATIVTESLPAQTQELTASDTQIEKTDATALTATSPALEAAEQPAPTLRSADKPILASRKHFLPTRRRIDREINKLKFAYKGEIMMGLTASYGTLSSEDAEFLVIVNNIDANATIATVKPFIGYFYSDNHAIGVRFGYSHTSGTLKNAAFDLGASNDIGGDIPYFDIKSDNYAFGVFHRSYAGLDPKGRFGLFAEFELSMSTGTSEFAYEQDGKPKRTFSDNMQLKLSFNPGASVYIFPNVCATLSFGLGGVQYTSVTQKDEQGNKIGSRKSSKMNFKLNIAAINFGMNIHLWDKKKK